MKRFHSLKGLHVSLTGTCFLPREELARRIVQRGGRVSGDRASLISTTDLLVRGDSTSWKHGSHGTKEAQAAVQVRLGSGLALISSDHLERLLAGQSVSELSFIAGFSVDDLRADAALAASSAAQRAPKRLDGTGAVTRRLEQALLREYHFRQRAFVDCGLCGSILPTTLLVVGHIKPRAHCSPKEKRDFANIAMPICLLGCDQLYERGFVSVGPNGRVVTSSVAKRTKALSSVLSRLKGRKCTAHTVGSAPYFAWHRRNSFQG